MAGLGELLGVAIIGYAGIKAVCWGRDIAGRVSSVMDDGVEDDDEDLLDVDDEYLDGYREGYADGFDVGYDEGLEAYER